MAPQKSQTGRDRVDWRRALGGVMTGGVLAAALVGGIGAPTAFAQPGDSTGAASDTRAPGENCTGDDCQKPVEGQASDGVDCSSDECPEREVTMTADQALTIIANEYRQGDGGGQLSVLIDDVLKLRAQGFKPSNANKIAIQDALAHRPNQTPLVEALRETLAYQRKLQAQAAMSSQAQGPVAGPVPVIPGGNSSINIPLG
jgi:hypothetical protein